MIWRIFAVVVFGGFGAMLGLWTTDREPPTRAARINVLTSEVRPGAELRIMYTVQRWRSCKTHVDRLLVDADGVRRDLADVDFAGAPGPLGETTYIISITIPRSFAQGRAHYKAISTYTCNPIQRMFSPIVVAGDDIEFEVNGDPLPPDDTPVEVIPRR